MRERESKGNKKEETECMKLDSKLYKPPEKGKGRDRKTERRGCLIESIRYTEMNPC